MVEMGEPKPRQPRGLSILWVDDEPDSVVGAQGVLEHDGHMVSLEPSVEVARQRLRDESFDLLIMDHRRQGDSAEGTRLVAEAKALTAANATTPFVFLTGYRGVSQEAESLSGYLGTYHKSSDIDAVLSELIERLPQGPTAAVDRRSTTAANPPKLVSASGLLRPDGSPLSATDPPYETLKLAFRAISDAALQWFADHPTRLNQMHDRDFEHLVAELFDRDGFDVTLTPSSADGGSRSLCRATRRTRIADVCSRMQAIRGASKSRAGLRAALARGHGLARRFGSNSCDNRVLYQQGARGAAQDSVSAFASRSG
jgi:CheY-like chemotaxis protein